MKLNRRRKIKGLFIFLYILFSIYFLNYPFEFVEIPDFILAIDKWVIFFGGILLVIGGFNLLRLKRKYAV